MRGPARVSVDSRRSGHPGHQIEGGHVFGEIDWIKLTCTEETADLDFEAGAEWSVPDNWTPCFVRVKAEKDTTFSFFEFE